MPEDAIVFVTHRLESDDYSVPKGSHGIVIELDTLPGFVEVHWIPPATGISAPVALADLTETYPLVIKKAWLEGLF